MSKKRVSARHRLVSRLTLTALGMAGIFGVNSVVFLINQRSLGSIASSIEDAQALAGSAELDGLLFINQLSSTSKDCQRTFPDGCENFIKTSISILNRNKDYDAVLGASFSASYQDQVIIQISESSKLVNLIAARSFGLSLETAKSKGVKTPRAYIAYVVTLGKYTDKVSFVNLSNALRLMTVAQYDSLRAFALAHTTAIPPFRRHQLITRYLFWSLVVIEIATFGLVGLIDISNNCDYSAELASESMEEGS